MQIQAFYQLSYCGSLFQLNYTYFSDGSDNPLFWGTVAIKKEIKQTEKKNNSVILNHSLCARGRFQTDGVSFYRKVWALGL